MNCPLLLTYCLDSDKSIPALTLLLALIHSAACRMAGLAVLL
jgi:hypothetical protein